LALKNTEHLLCRNREPESKNKTNPFLRQGAVLSKKERREQKDFLKQITVK